MKRLEIISLFFLIIMILSSCEWIFGPPQNNLSRDLIIEYQVGDILIYSTDDDARIDTLEVTKYGRGYNDIENYEQIIVGFKKTNGEQFVAFTVAPYWIGIEYMSNPSLIFNPDDPTYDVEINDKKYRNVYVCENDLQGADSLIYKTQYHSKTGILSYKYENGDEYLLDTIIEVE